LVTPDDIEVVGHRVVHGGAEFTEPTFITSDVHNAIQRYATYAPGHNPAALEGIAVVTKLLGDVPQVAVFDTAFHRTLPPAASVYPLPYQWTEQGVLRYGFHGISHKYCAERAAQLLNRDLAELDLITCHLGNGCSLAAIHAGQSIDTTMGFTPLDGLMMGTRPGVMDPGIILYLLRQPQVDTATLERMLNQESGLLGVSGISGDMRQIDQARNQGSERAQLAFDMFIHRLRAGIGSMLAALGHIDALIFTAGIGEHSTAVRDAACRHFSNLGIEIDQVRNATHPVDQDIAKSNAQVRVLVIHTQEDWAIARVCFQFV
jgi:acetate kinase